MSILTADTLKAECEANGYADRLASVESGVADLLDGCSDCNQVKKTAKARVDRDAERIHYHCYPSWALRTVNYVVILALIPLLVLSAVSQPQSDLAVSVQPEQRHFNEAVSQPQSDLAVSVQPEQRHFNDWLSKVPPLSCGARSREPKSLIDDILSTRSTCAAAIAMSSRQCIGFFASLRGGVSASQPRTPWDDKRWLLARQRR